MAVDAASRINQAVGSQGIESSWIVSLAGWLADWLARCTAD